MDGVTTAHRGRSLYILADTDRAASAIFRSECQSCKRKKYNARQEVEIQYTVLSVSRLDSSPSSERVKAEW